MDNQFQLKRGSFISHPQYGIGEIRSDEGTTVIVRFDHGIEECPKTDLTPIQSLRNTIASPQWHPPQELIAKIQALSIRSVNDLWGIFSLARINLLPHQLWVCRRVVQELPTHWLIADDVGLGKTIEAGLILWTLLNKKAINRILILCPAKLTGQWQYRLRTMFDIRITLYTTEADRPQSDFWNTHHQVIASLPTLRKDSQGRHHRIFEAAPWDLLIVDEAHHLNADEQTGPTLGYTFLNNLIHRHKRVSSIVFFTGTPHRGKHYQFFALLQLLRPDLFDAKKGVQSEQALYTQMANLKQVMVRNNKQLVTDMKGNRLFSPVQVSSETYSYTLEEEYFYNKLTEFILTGKAYASGLTALDQRTVMLILICMQKLASSSISAIRKALKGRLNRLAQNEKELETLKKRQKVISEMQQLLNQEDLDEDEVNDLEERILELSDKVILMQDEKPRLEELIEAAETVRQETKILKILEIIEDRFPSRQLLFFTEYKATQALLMSSLLQKYGENCVTFINGDERLENVINTQGKQKNYQERRENAATRFNQKEVRFLISTEAGGEGIDLQDNCHSLIHVDLPWNPMRLHQRVGRLNRYGQTKTVEVITLRNPDTVETRIWDKLNEKITNIMLSMQSIMEEPEDLLQLVLGMTSPKLFREIFSEAADHKDNLSRWFDQKTARFGGKDVITTVQELIGSCNKFDFQESSPLLPHADLPDLQPFFITMLQFNKRRVKKDDDNTLSFKTPEVWLQEMGVLRDYDGLHFDRSCRDQANQLLGVGHKLINLAIAQASEFPVSIAQISNLESPLWILQVRDRVTGLKANTRQVIVGLQMDSDGQTPVIFKDWEILQKLNDLSQHLDRSPELTAPKVSVEALLQNLKQAETYISQVLPDLSLPFQIPQVQAIALLHPSVVKNHDFTQPKAIVYGS